LLVAGAHESAAIAAFLKQHAGGHSQHSIHAAGDLILELTEASLDDAMQAHPLLFILLRDPTCAREADAADAAFRAAAAALRSAGPPSPADAAAGARAPAFAAADGDSASALQQHFNALSLPTVIVVERDGPDPAEHDGPLDAAALTRRARTLAAPPSAPVAGGTAAAALLAGAAGGLAASGGGDAAGLGAWAAVARALRGRGLTFSHAADDAARAALGVARGQASATALGPGGYTERFDAGGAGLPAAADELRAWAAAHALAAGGPAAVRRLDRAGQEDFFAAGARFGGAGGVAGGGRALLLLFLGSAGDEDGAAALGEFRAAARAARAAALSAYFEAEDFPEVCVRVSVCVSVSVSVSVSVCMCVRVLVSV
jgi:hypothetical protein